jgi:hypothetical protein
MSKDSLIKHFTTDLRRLLYMNEITLFTLQSMKGNAVTPQWLKVAINNQINCIKNLKAELSRRGSQESWDAIYEDITDDRMHDIALHMDFIAPVRNIAQITSILQEHATTQTAS